MKVKVEIEVEGEQLEVNYGNASMYEALGALHLAVQVLKVDIEDTVRATRMLYRDGGENEQVRPK